METIFPFSTNYFYIKSFSLVGGNVFPSSGNHLSANIYLLKFSNRNTTKRCEIYSKLTMKTPVQRH